MKIREIIIRGFRGFNSERAFDVHDRLTLIAAPNSHGKTSISEACEWLLYGQTSKVVLAESKEEFKDSYRNIHFLQPESPSVTMTIDGDDGAFTLTGLMSGKEIVRKLNGKVVNKWPFEDLLAKSPKPFILQHALKDLLLAKPVERFNRFSELLGFDEVARAHKDLVALCTRPPMDPVAETLLAQTKAFITRASADETLAKVAKALSRDTPSFELARESLYAVARSQSVKKVADEKLLDVLQSQRDEAVAKIFDGRIAIRSVSPEEKEKIAAMEKRLAILLADEVTPLVSSLASIQLHATVLKKLKLFELGLELLGEQPSICPLCDQELTPAATTHIEEHHRQLTDQAETARSGQEVRDGICKGLQELESTTIEYFKLLVSGMKDLLAAQSSVERLLVIWGDEGQKQKRQLIQEICHDLGLMISEIKDAGSAVRRAIKETRDNVSGGRPVENSQLTQVAEALYRFLQSGRKVQPFTNAHSSELNNLQIALSDELNKQAGTTSLNLLIELLQNERKIQKSLRVQSTIDGLKALKSSADEIVTRMMLDAISGSLATEVMTWYDRIRTTGDPDVHFAGFDMKRTQHGGRVQIKATSYGRELVSAVSSLSESKLNALGLAISIAMNLSQQSSFDFLIIDDPIQSWDKDHEMQFIEVIRDLVIRGKQIVLLSHNIEWVRQVRAACADLDGMYYEITGYTNEGPCIKASPWVEPKQRLQAIAAILDDQSADSVRLQHAEQELRQVFSSLASMLYESVTGAYKDPAKLNSEKIRKMLTECNIDPKHVAGIMAIFVTVDDAHHSAENYVANRQKIRQYLGVAQSVLQAVEGRLKSAPKQVITISTAKGA